MKVLYSWAENDPIIADSAFSALQWYDRFTPHWWFPDVPKQAIGSIRKLENVLPFLRQASHPKIAALITVHHAECRP